MVLMRSGLSKSDCIKGEFIIWDICSGFISCGFIIPGIIPGGMFAGANGFTFVFEPAGTCTVLLTVGRCCAGGGDAATVAAGEGGTGARLLTR